MKPQIKKRIESIRKDRQHGATWLTEKALEILRDICDINYAHERQEDFIKEIAEAVVAIRTARPSMVSIANFSTQFLEEVQAAASGSRSTIKLKKRAYAIVTRLLELNAKSTALLCKKAYPVIKNRSIVMTCSYSDTVCTVLEYARSRGKDFKVLAIQSLFNNISYGEITAERLKKSNIVCRIIPDSQIAWHVARADMTILGADAICWQGWLLNGTPSHKLANLSNMRNIPVYVICSKSKFDPRGFLAGIIEPEPGFDKVPLKLINSIISEAEIYRPDQIYDLTNDDIFRSRRVRVD